MSSHDEGFFTGNYDTNSVIVTICAALGFYNSLELILLIFTTFLKYRGLYFWSLVIATSAIIPYNVGLVLFYFQLTAKAAGLIINNYGWITMVIGQSVVLYSRLGIVLGKGGRRILGVVKWMIIVDAVAFYVTTTGTIPLGQSSDSC